MTTWKPHPFLLLLLLLPIGHGALFADRKSAEIEAHALLENGNYDEAIIAYEKLLSETGDNPDTLFNLGIAYYRTLRFSSAENSFEKALQLKIEDPVFQSHAEYNIGNAFFQQAKLFWKENPQRSLFYLRESVEAFDNAVELQSDFESAKSNLAKTKALLADLQQKLDESRADEETQTSESPTQEEQPESDQEEGTSSDQSEGSQNRSESKGTPTGNPNGEPTRDSQDGGGEPGELMDVNEAMMLLDSVELDEKRITLSKLLDETPSAETGQPDW